MSLQATPSLRRKAMIGLALLAAGSLAPFLGAEPTVTQYLPTGYLTPKLGETLVLTVHAEGKGPVIYRWFKSGLPLRDHVKDTLTIDNLKQSDQGEYSVIAQDQADGKEQACGWVIVSPQPRAQEEEKAPAAAADACAFWLVRNQTSATWPVLPSTVW